MRIRRLNSDWSAARWRRTGSFWISPNLDRCGFSLIELLVVISIIGVLASLTVGLSSVASRKSKEARMKGELDKHVTAIEGYKAALGMYPPDNPGRPAMNPLFYELTGTLYTNVAGQGSFLIPSRQKGIPDYSVKAVFGTLGFSNSVRTEEQPKFSEEFKASQFKEVAASPPVEILVVPLKAPPTFTYNGAVVPLPIKATDGTIVNPWLYDSSSSTRHNRRGFDLWAEVIIGRNIVRFCNWEKDPVVVGRIR